MLEERGEFCGVPMPLPGLSLTLEDRHPFSAEVAAMQRIIDEDAPPSTRVCTDDDMSVTLVNSWYSFEKRGHIQIIRDGAGKIHWQVEPEAPTRNKLNFGPLATLDAWDLDTELTAIDALAEMLTERMFKAYILGGSFLETSKRSKLTYWFRRCRPTVVLTPHGPRARTLEDAAVDAEYGDMRILVALCLHPLAYYSNTYCGAMCPTDDVIAHLQMMRADEHKFWQRANHHAAYEVRSGL